MRRLRAKRPRQSSLRLDVRDEGPSARSSVASVQSSRAVTEVPAQSNSDEGSSMSRLPTYALR